MAEEEKFWLLKNLFEIPVLKFNDEDLRYPAIMSQFHYLLLGQNKSTYEEFVKYWALLIVTAPDAFKEQELYKKPVFDEVYSKAIKFSLSEEKIELPPGHLTIVEAENFYHRTWKLNLDEPIASKMDDSVVHEWYKNPDNTIEARAFFGLYCINLMRAYTSSPASVAKECGETIFSLLGKYSVSFKLERNISFNTGTAIFVRDAFRSQAETFLEVLRIVLDWSCLTVQSTAENTFEAFFRRFSVSKPLGCFDISISNPTMSCQMHSDWIEKIQDVKVLSSMKKLATLTSYLDGVRSQDERFLEDNPNCIGESCKLWEYSRLSSPQYFKSLADEDNLEFLAFCAGLNMKSTKELDSIVCLKKLNNRLEYYKLGEAIARPTSPYYD